MSGLFTRIVNGEIPCHKILEDDKFLAFLDIKPVKQGHTLVIPKQEIDYIFDMDDHKIGQFMIFAKKTALMIKQAIRCKKIGMMVAGLEVAHAHIHLIPINSIDDLNFSLAKDCPNEELCKTAEMIRLKKPY